MFMTILSFLSSDVCQNCFREESGWIIESVECHYIDSCNYNLLIGNSYIQFPKD